MRTVKNIQQEVLATAQVTLDELRASIEKFWEQGWSTYQEALSLYKSSASIMISGLKQELDIRKLPSSLRLSVYSASNLDDMGLPKFMNEYKKY